MMMTTNCPECDVEIAEDTVVCPGCASLLDDMTFEVHPMPNENTELKFETDAHIGGKIRLLSGILTILGFVAIINGKNQGFLFLYGGLSIFIASSVTSWWIRKKTG